MYDKYYRLSGRPFQLTPDPEFYFESNTHRKAMSYLGYGLAQGEGFIVITGEIGAGKTTLVAHLMETIDRQRLTAAQIVTTQLQSSDLIQMVARAFGIDTNGLDKSTTLKSIEYFLHGEARAGRRCLLIIDKSQNLPVGALEELRMLSNFQLGSHPLLQIFLLGQPEFRVTVQRSRALEQLRQRIIATHHLEAMGVAEIQPYIEHRLRKVGWQGHPRFTSESFSRLYEASKGVPRMLNTLTNRVMLMGALEQRDEIGADIVEHVIADLNEDGASVASDGDTPEEYDINRKLNHDQFGDDGQKAGEFSPHKPIVSAPLSQSDHGYKKHDSAISTQELQLLKSDIASLRRQMESHDGEGDGSSHKYDMAMDRINAIEARLGAQERALRKVLTLLIDWAETKDIDALREQFM